MTQVGELTIPIVAKELREITREVAGRYGVAPEKLAYHDLVLPDGVNTDCLYVLPRKQAPACIVGQWLHKQGVALSELMEHESTGAEAMIPAVLPGVPHAVTQFLGEVQSEQDGDQAWMDAIARGESLFLRGGYVG